ncbi:hypothetical protein ABC795_09295 [Blastococcus sp. HT6-30]|uniref:hypothetical protein n=1 Tax=Blastococcus sp. HT6-30 TaxID=3144843 RepID=UPI003219C8E6
MQTTAVLSGLVPYGLFFLVTVAYTVGAARSSGRGALVQQVNAIESVTNVDVVCPDKTGTLTTGRPRPSSTRPSPTHRQLRPPDPTCHRSVQQSQPDHLIGRIAET